MAKLMSVHGQVSEENKEEPKAKAMIDHAQVIVRAARRRVERGGWIEGVMVVGVFSQAQSYRWRSR